MNLDGGGSNGDAVVGLDELASRFRPLKMRIAGFGGKTTLARRIVERLGPGMVYIGEDALHFVDSGGGSEKPEKELGVDGYGDSGSLAIGLSSGTEDDDCEIGVVEAGAKKDKVVVAGDEDSDGAARKRKTKTKPKPSKKKGFQVRPSADVAAAADAATLAFLAVELMPAPCPTPPSPARLAQAAPTYYRQASQNSPLPTHHSPSRSPQPLGFVSDGFWADLHAIINPQTHVTILLDYPLSTCLYRVTKRTLKRWWSGELLFGGQLKETLLQLYGRGALKIDVLLMSGGKEDLIVR
ncbi:hypothetical protein HK100_005245 [Physocladia obscura]|uniref:Uncharacterized protein n=1 Tax=Physocladia obscura TaxID=109957 RepID=A0AAD5XCF6_9FUNG|nr:hypothetical protein HK100_005245 [Physocladia obscura]